MDTSMVGFILFGGIVVITTIVSIIMDYSDRYNDYRELLLRIKVILIKYKYIIAGFISGILIYQLFKIIYRLIISYM